MFMKKLTACLLALCMCVGLLVSITAAEVYTPAEDVPGKIAVVAKAIEQKNGTFDMQYQTALNIPKSMAQRVSVVTEKSHLEGLRFTCLLSDKYVKDTSIPITESDYVMYGPGSVFFEFVELQRDEEGLKLIYKLSSDKIETWADEGPEKLAEDLQKQIIFASKIMNTDKVKKGELVPVYASVSISNFDGSQFLGHDSVLAAEGSTYLLFTRHGWTVDRPLSYEYAPNSGFKPLENEASGVSKPRGEGKTDTTGTPATTETPTTPADPEVTGTSDTNVGPALPSESGVDEYLITDEHVAYLIGYEDGTFGPEKTFTRAHAAQMIYRLLKNKDVEITVTPNDVDGTEWFATAINVIASMGLLDLDDEGNIRPTDPITRAEFAVAMYRLATNDGAYDTLMFPDVAVTYWAYEEINGAAAFGWLEGFGDGEFKPENYMKRAEAVTMINRMLCRHADEEVLSELEDVYTDVPSDYWAYADIMEASIAHSYESTGLHSEKWLDYEI